MILIKLHHAELVKTCFWVYQLFAHDFFSLDPMGFKGSGFELWGQSSGLLARYGCLRPLLRQIVCDERTHEISLTADQQERALQSYKRKYGCKDQKDLEQHRLNELLSIDDLKYQIEQPEKLKCYYKESFSSQAEAHFLLRKNALDQVTYSLLRVRDDGLARELYLQILDEEASFAELANKHSQGRERKTSGLIGPLPIDQAHPLLAQRLRASHEGELIEPFQVENWWLLVRLESLSPATFDEAIANQMSQELFNQWLEVEVSERLSSIEEHLPSKAPANRELLGL